MEVISAADYRASQGSRSKGTKAATKAPQATPVPAAAVASLVVPVSRVAAEVTHYIGPYQLNVANGTHYPGRSRCVVVGPASDELTAALVAALTQFHNQQP